MGTTLRSQSFEEKVKGEFRSCILTKYNYRNGKLDINSKRNLIQCKYDSRGKIIERLNYDSNDYAYMKYKYIYDSLGNKIEERYYLGDKIQNITQNSYDEQGNKIKETSYNSEGNIYRRSESKYDKNGNLIEVNTYLSGNKYKDIYKYNEFGNRTEMIYYVDGEKHRTELIYDDNGNMIEGICYNPDGSVHHKSVYKYKYDSNGYEKEHISHYNDGRLRENIIDKYDNQGNLIEITSLNSDGIIGMTVQYKYDKNGNEIESIESYETGSIKRQYRYDEFGNKIEEIYFNIDEDPSGKLIWEYSK